MVDVPTGAARRFLLDLCREHGPVVPVRGDHRSLRDHLRDLVDTLGSLSARAQGLPQPITTAARLTSSGGDHVLYLHVSGDGAGLTCNGMIKTGSKNLFVRDASGRMHELRGHRCVLDFYVHESRQRRGLGRALMEKALEFESLDPGHLAYDRPSPKYVAFLRKHYGLAEYVPQSNNFVVFNDYFRGGPPRPGRRFPEQPTGTTADADGAKGRKKAEQEEKGGGEEEEEGRTNRKGGLGRPERHQQHQQISTNNGSNREMPPQHNNANGRRRQSRPEAGGWRAPGPAGNKDDIHSHFTNASPTKFASTSAQRPRYGRRSTSPSDQENPMGTGLVSTGPAGIVTASSMREIERLRSSLRASEASLDALKAQQREKSASSSSSSSANLSATAPPAGSRNNRTTGLYRPF